MIFKFRRRFIVVMVFLMSVVSFIVNTAIYLFMYHSEYKNAFSIIDMAIDLPEDEVEQSSFFDEDILSEKVEPKIRFDKHILFGLSFDKDENSYSSGWIRITSDNEGNVTGFYNNQKRYFESDNERRYFYATAAAVVRKIAGIEKNRGIMSVNDHPYRFRMADAPDGNGKILVLLDQTDEISLMFRLFRILIMIFMISLVIICVIAYFLSGWVTAPIDDAWKRQNVFFSNASHELKTPLTVISANLDLITSNPSETIESQEKWFGFIREETEKMKKLINEMLYLSKEERSDIEYPVCEFDFSRETEGACLSMEAVAFEKGKVLKTDIEENIHIKASRENIIRMINILIDNGISHSAPDSTVTVSLKKVRGKVRLSVESIGCTISSENLERIFDRYYRTDASRCRDTGGFGLGLSIAKAIAEHSGGSISARSENGHTVFTVVL